MSEHWALQQVKIRNTLPLEEAQKKYKNITKKKARKVRDTKNFYVFRHIPPTKFEKKSFRTKVVNDDVQMVFGKLKEGQEELSGSGLFDYFKKGVDYAQQTASNVADSVKNAFNIRDYSKKAKDMLDKYGNYPVVGLEIRRHPIQSDPVFEAISLGQWSTLKKKYGYDDMFHMMLVCTLKKPDSEAVRQVKVEQVGVISINDNIEVAPGDQVFEVNMGDKAGTFTLRQMLDKTQERLGTSKFFEYSSFTESGCNCQGLVANLLRTEGLYSDEAHKFVYQDVTGIYKELHSYVPKVADATTKAIALASKWFNIGGEKEGGVHDFFDGEYENEPVTLNSLVGGKYFSKNPDLEFLKYANEHKHDLEGPHTIKQMYKDWEEMRGGNKASGFIQAMMARKSKNKDVQNHYKGQVEQMNGRRRKPITTKELNRQKFQDFDAEGFRMKKMSKTTHDVANRAPPSKKPAEAFYEYVKQHAPAVRPPVIKNDRGQVITNYRGTYDLDNMYSAWKSGRAPITESPSSQVAEVPEVKEEKVEPMRPKRKIKVAEPEPEPVAPEPVEVKEEEKKETKEERKARHDAIKAKNEEKRARKAEKEAKKAEKEAKKAKKAEKEAKKKARENETPEEKRRRKMIESNKKADAERAEMFRKAEEEAKAERERQRLNPTYEEYRPGRSLAEQVTRREMWEDYNKEQRKIRKAEMKSQSSGKGKKRMKGGSEETPEIVEEKKNETPEEKIEIPVAPRRRPQVAPEPEPVPLRRRPQVAPEPMPEPVPLRRRPKVAPEPMPEPVPLRRRPKAFQEPIPEPVPLRRRPKVAPEPAPVARRRRPKVAPEEKTKKEKIQDLMKVVPKDLVNMMIQMTGNPHQEVFTPELKTSVEEAIGGNEDGYDDDNFHPGIFLDDTLEKIGKDTKKIKSNEYGFSEYGGSGSGIGNMVDVIQQAYSNLHNPTFRLTISDDTVHKGGYDDFGVRSRNEERRYYKMLKELYKHSEFNSMTSYINNNYGSVEDYIENIKDEDELSPSHISKYTLKIRMPTEKARADAITFLRELREFISDKYNEKDEVPGQPKDTRPVEEQWYNYED